MARRILSHTRRALSRSRPRSPRLARVYVAVYRPTDDRDPSHVHIPLIMLSEDYSRLRKDRAKIDVYSGQFTSTTGSITTASIKLLINSSKAATA